MQRAHGFTLVEVVMILVALSFMAAFFAGIFAELPRAVDVNESAQSASQLAQACSDRVIARRRNSAVGFAAIASGACVGLPVLTGYTVTDVVDATYAGAACPVAGQCKRVTVTVQRNAVTVAQTDFVLVNY